MNGRTLFICAVLAAGLLALLLFRGAAVEGTPAAPRPDVALEHPASAPAELANAETPAAPRESVAAAAHGESIANQTKAPASDGLHYFGKVVASKDQRAIAGATIEVLEVGEMSSTTKTNANGVFELARASWKEPDLFVRAPGYTAVFVQVGPGHENESDAKIIRLSRSASLRARVIDGSGAALRDGAVHVWVEARDIGIPVGGDVYEPMANSYMESSSGPNTSWTASTDASGRCVLTDLPSGMGLQVEILSGEEVVKRDLPLLELAAGETREVVWQVGAGCVLEGRLVDQDDKPVGPRTIRMKRAQHDHPYAFQKYDPDETVVESEAGEDGRFRFIDVAAGKYWVGPAANDEDDEMFDPDAISTQATLVEIVQHGGRQEVLVRVYRGLYIRGRVLDPAGGPSPMARVTAANETRTIGLADGTDQDGTFVIGPLAPGRFTLSAIGVMNARCAPVEASAGTEDVILQLARAGSVRGSVIDAATGKGCQALVLMTPRDSTSWNDTMPLPTNSKGDFLLSGFLLPGTYDLAASARGSLVGILTGVEIRADAETSDIVVKLVPGSTLRVKNSVNAEFLHYRVLNGDVLVAEGDMKTAENVEITVPPGHLVVEWGVLPVDVKRLEVDLAEGEVRQIVLGGG